MGNLIKDKTAKKLEPICVWANPDDVTSFVGTRVSELQVSMKSVLFKRTRLTLVLMNTYILYTSTKITATFKKESEYDQEMQQSHTTDKTIALRERGKSSDRAMSWPHVGGLSYVQVDLAHHEIFRAKVGKGVIKTEPHWIGGNLNNRRTRIKIGRNSV